METMRRFAVFLSLLVASMAVPVASAESFTSDMGPPKGVAGHGGIRCVGEASGDGHTFRLVMYFGANGPEAREQAWQASRCESKMRRAVVAWAGTAYDGRYCLAWYPESRIRGHAEPDDLYCSTKPSVKVAPGDVKVTVERM
jgi:hypothetical protein